MRHIVPKLDVCFRRGNSVVEAVLVFPLLLALMFGTTEYGFYFYGCVEVESVEEAASC